MMNTKTHGYMDYAMGILLIVIPFVLPINNPTAANIFIWMGIGVLLYSLLTNYELGIIKVIPIGVYLTIDILGGIFLIASPWLFGFSEEVYLPFIILGAVEVLTGLMTKKEPVYHSEKV